MSIVSYADFSGGAAEIDDLGFGFNGLADEA